MLPKQVVMEFVTFAESVISEEKANRIRSSKTVVYPMKFFFFHDQDSVTALVGSPFRKSNLDEKEQMSLAARLFALALDAHAVLHICESWTANHCAVCTTSVADIKDGRCNHCGSEIVPPSENPHREEVLFATLSIKSKEKTLFWTSRFERDVDGRIVGFTDQLKRCPMEGSGRFTQLWALESWMMPHFAVNLCVVLQALGKQVDGRSTLISRTTEKMAPADYPFIRVSVEDVQAVVRKMRSGSQVGKEG